MPLAKATAQTQGFLPVPFAQWPAEARLLLGMVALWCLLGLVVLGSASWWVAAREMGDPSYYLKRQAIWLVASWGLLYLGLRINLRRWLRLAAPALLIGAVLVALTLVIGSTVNGASRWLVIGPVQIQPTELIKPFLVLQGAALFSHWKRISADQKLIWLGVFAVVLGLILKQPNLSTAALCGLLLWLMALASGLPMVAMLGTAAAGAAVGVGSIAINEYQRIRVTSFLNPWTDAQGDGYQLVQSLLAIGSGDSGARVLAYPPRNCNICRSRAPTSSSRCLPRSSAMWARWCCSCSWCCSAMWVCGWP